MKKLSILFVSILTLGLSLSSCSNNDDNSASIEGKWETTYEGTIVDGKEVLEPAETNGNCAQDYIEFLTNGTFNDIIFHSDCQSTNDNGTWSKKDNKLTIKYNGNSESNVVEILILNSTTLKIKNIITEAGQPDEIHITVAKKL